MSVKLFVGNLAADTTQGELRELFSTAGTVESCRVIIDRTTGYSKGFAFIEMTSLEGASLAVEKFNGEDFHGKPMKVNEARQRI